MRWTIRLYETRDEIARPTPTIPTHLRSLTSEAYDTLYTPPHGTWSELQHTTRDRCIRHMHQLTHMDWQAVPHRDTYDVTPLRTLKPRPTRSLYLYRDEQRDTTITRARLRHNRAATARHLYRLDPWNVTGGCCISCSLPRQTGVVESVSHLLLDCPRYAAYRTRLRAQFGRMRLMSHSSMAYASSPIPLTLASILDAPPPALLPPRCTHQQRQRIWIAWTRCTGQFIRRIEIKRQMEGWPPL